MCKGDSYSTVEVDVDNETDFSHAAVVAIVADIVVATVVAVVTL